MTYDPSHALPLIIALTLAAIGFVAIWATFPRDSGDVEHHPV